MGIQQNPIRNDGTSSTSYSIINNIEVANLTNVPISTFTNDVPYLQANTLPSNILYYSNLVNILDNVVYTSNIANVVFQTELSNALQNVVYTSNIANVVFQTDLSNALQNVVYTSNIANVVFRSELTTSLQNVVYSSNIANVVFQTDLSKALENVAYVQSNVIFQNITSSSITLPNTISFTGRMSQLQQDLPLANLSGYIQYSNLANISLSSFDGFSNVILVSNLETVMIDVVYQGNDVVFGNVDIVDTLTVGQDISAGNTIFANKRLQVGNIILEEVQSGGKSAWSIFTDAVGGVDMLCSAGGLALGAAGVLTNLFSTGADGVTSLADEVTDPLTQKLADSFNDANTAIYLDYINGIKRKPVGVVYGTTVEVGLAHNLLMEGSIAKKTSGISIDPNNNVILDNNSYDNIVLNIGRETAYLKETQTANLKTTSIYSLDGYPIYCKPDLDVQGNVSSQRSITATKDIVALRNSYTTNVAYSNIVNTTYIVGNEEKLDVFGDTRAHGNLVVDTTTTTNVLRTREIQSLNSNNVLVIRADLTRFVGAVLIDPADLSIEGDLGLWGNVTIGNNLWCSGNTKITGNLQVNTDMYLNGNLITNGDIFIVSNTIDFSCNTFSVSGDTYMVGNLKTDGAMTMFGNIGIVGNCAITSDIQLQGNIQSVDESMWIAANNLSLVGNVSVSGFNTSLTVGGVSSITYPGNPAFRQDTNHDGFSTGSFTMVDKVYNGDVLTTSIYKGNAQMGIQCVPSYTLDVNGDARIRGNVFINDELYIKNQNIKSYIQSSTGNLWYISNTASIQTVAANVVITNPSLIANTMTFGGWAANVTFSTNYVPYLQFSQQFNAVNLTAGANGLQVQTANGYQTKPLMTFRNTGTNSVGGTGYVGVNTNAPTCDLDVKGQTKTWQLTTDYISSGGLTISGANVVSTPTAVLSTNGVTLYGNVGIVNGYNSASLTVNNGIYSPNYYNLAGVPLVSSQWANVSTTKNITTPGNVVVSGNVVASGFFYSNGVAVISGGSGYVSNVNTFNANLNIITGSQFLYSNGVSVASSGGNTQFNNVSGGINYPTGNVGIQNSSPQFTLDVRGTINANINASTMPAISVSSNNQYQTCGMQIYNTTMGQTSWQIIMAGASGASGGAIPAGSFHIFGGDDRSAMCINRYGNSGLGRAPTGNYKLDVVGNVNITDALSSGTLNATSLSVSGTNISSIYQPIGSYITSIPSTFVSNNSSYNLSCGATSVSTLSVGANATNNPTTRTTYTILTSPNDTVGNPSASATILCRALLISAGTAGGGALWNFSGAPNVYGSDLILTGGNLNDGGNNGSGPVNYYPGNVYIQSGIGYNGVGGQASGTIVFQTGSGAGTSYTERMRVHSNGNVGIGTQSPTTTLDVNGVIKGTGFTFPLGSWLTSTDGKNRLYFGASGKTYYASASGDHEWRVDNTGATVGMTLAATSGAIYTLGNGQFNTCKVGDPGFGSTYAAFAHSSVFGTSGYALLNDSSGSTYLNCLSGQVMYFRMSNSTVGNWTSSGLSIGSSAASYPLDVSGAIRATGNVYLTNNKVGLSYESGDYMSINTGNSTAGTGGVNITVNNTVMFSLGSFGTLQMTPSIPGKNFLMYNTSLATNANMQMVVGKRSSTQQAAIVGYTNATTPYSSFGLVDQATYNINCTTTGTGIFMNNPQMTLDVNGIIGTSSNTSIGAPATGVAGNVGTRLVLYQGTTTAYPYALGINSSEMWRTSPGVHKWYYNNVNTMTLGTQGDLVVVSNVYTRSGFIGNPNLSTDTAMYIMNKALTTPYGGSAPNNNFALYQGDTADTVVNAGSGQQIQFKIANVEKVRVHSNGFVGINVASPTCPLHISGSGTQTVGGGNYFSGSLGITGWTSSAQTLSIATTNSILTNQYFLAVSDKRLKKNFVDVDGSESLKTLLKLPIKSFKKIDAVMLGDKMQLGVVAQEIESIVPDAINVATDFIPSVYTNIDCVSSSNVIHIAGYAFNDCKNKEIKFFYEDENQCQQEVIGVVGNDERCIIHNKGMISTGNVFVYGTKEMDVRSVDYNSLYTLGLSATQELYNIIQNQQEELKNLTIIVNELRARIR